MKSCVGIIAAASIIFWLMNFRIPVEIEARLAGVEGMVARLARNLIGRCLAADHRDQRPPHRDHRHHHPAGPGAAGHLRVWPVDRSQDRGREHRRGGPVPFAAAYARYTGTAPQPVWSSNQPRHRSRAPGTGNSTPPSTASPSPRPAATPAPEHCSNGAEPTATEPAKPSGSCDAACPTSSTSPSKPTNRGSHASPLDTGAIGNASGVVAVRSAVHWPDAPGVSLAGARRSPAGPGSRPRPARGCPGPPPWSPCWPLAPAPRPRPASWR